MVLNGSNREPDLFQSVGSFGRYQVLQFVIISLTIVFGVELLSNNFILYTPDHWCKPANSRQYNLSVEELRNLTIPWNDETGSFSSCEMYHQALQNSSDAYDIAHAKNTSEIMRDSHNLFHRRGKNISIISCQSWNFDDSEYTNTAVTEWQLVCDKAWLIDFISSSQSLGKLFSSLIAGWFSDRFGRWKGTLVAMVIKLAGGLVSLFAPTYLVFIVGRTILSFGNVAVYLITFVLAMETTSPGHRAWMGAVIGVVYSIGSMLLAGLAYVERDWKRLQIYYIAANVAIMISIFFFVHESPRWLIQKGLKEKGTDVLKKIAKFNKKPYLEKVSTLEEQTKNLDNSNNKVSISKLFATPSMRKYSFICFTTWFTICLIFYALSLNAKALSGNIFINFFFLAAVEAPSNILAFFALRTKLFGRKRTCVITYLMAGVACLIIVPLIVFQGKSYITTIFAIIGKAGATAGFTSIYLYTTELYPTEIRSLALGISSLGARLGGILAPYAGGTLGTLWTPLPALIFGITGTSAGILILLLPETRGRVLKDTVQEEELDQKKINQLF